MDNSDEQSNPEAEVGKDVIQLKKKKAVTKGESDDNVYDEADFLADDNINLSTTQVMEALKIVGMDYNDIMEDEDRCCPEEERSSLASDYFRKPSNVDISPPPESSETKICRQQEYLKHLDKIKLTEQQADCLTIIVQDSVYEMLILNNCNRQLLEEMTLQARGDGKNSPGRDGDSNTQLGSEALKLAKMESDRKYITETLIKVYLDLLTNKSFPSLLVHLSDLSAKSYQGIARETHYKELKSKLRKLEAKLVRDIEGHKNKLLQCDREIYKLMDDIDDSTWNSEIRTRYVDAWQNAQMEQHTLAIEKTEGGPGGGIKATQDLINKENKIHNEIVKYFKASTEDYSDQIEMWMERYDNELDQLDMDIRLMKEKRDVQMDETNELQNLMDEHKREMDEWQAVLDERARKKALEELMLFSAIKLQAWWRGVLARKLYAKMLKKKYNDSCRCYNRDKLFVISVAFICCIMTTLIASIGMWHFGLWL